MGDSDKMYTTLLIAALAGTSHAISANCIFEGIGNGEVTGEIILNHDGKETEIHGEILGLSPGLHGFHIHENGDLSEDCGAAGGHYNPMGSTHGSPGNDDATRHVGDLGNIAANDEGRSDVRIEDHLVSLVAEDNVLGRAIVVHELLDDLGLGGDDASLSNGNAGARVGCCIITELIPTTP